MLKIALICGGPSLERGISLNSARSVMDHLAGSTVQIIPLYVDHAKHFYLLSPFQLYSNTPSDFDFKLDATAHRLSEDGLREFFKGVDLAFPVIHGAFGEDGQLQGILEAYGVPYVGPSRQSCEAMFCKHAASQTLKQHGFKTIPSIKMGIAQKTPLKTLQDFFSEFQIQRAVVKPAKGGSSIGVFSVSSPRQAFVQCKVIFDRKIDDWALIEPFCEGREFTVLVLENDRDEPVALLPTEIEMDYGQNQIFDYRKKYLPTNQAIYHTPPRFDQQTIDQIRSQAEAIFKLFGMRDFVRLDGWILNDGRICFTDINPLSGLEQNSFLFRQTAVLGMTHRQTLEYIVSHACKRYAIPFAKQSSELSEERLPVYVLFGNHNAERQVSLMSGTNVWLKLLRSEKHRPIPCLYDFNGKIWELPYSHALNHTVEEIYLNCLTSEEIAQKSTESIASICGRLSIQSHSFIFPLAKPLDHFLEQLKAENAFAFIAMHGAEGEDGTLQKKFEEHAIPFNGSNSAVSAICMDKYLTGHLVAQMNDPDILTVPKARLDFNRIKGISFEKIWEGLKRDLAANRMIIKPRSDGCSAGIVVLQSAADLEKYAAIVRRRDTYIKPHTFSNQPGTIEMPLTPVVEYIIEPYIETDRIVIEEKKLRHFPHQGWIELTVGVLEEGGRYSSLNPSIAIAEGAVLSLEEKFQGGTGINLTPPPEEILSTPAAEKIKRMVEKIAQNIGIQNYARLDIFFNRQTGRLILIEVNSLPALTPSTVLYHQALTENPPLTPKALLEKIIENKLVKCNRAHV